VEQGGGRRIVHDEVPVQRSPSGLVIRHLVTEREGATVLFVGEQWFEPGDEVPRHTHPVEEVLTFLAGEGEATLGDEQVAIGAGVSLYVPPGLVHGFRCTGGETLRVLVVFPTPRFAETTVVED
jgi:quercetin dioxygenase-like cupin family protein